MNCHNSVSYFGMFLKSEKDVKKGYAAGETS